jgi:hypothetical protein
MRYHSLIRISGGAQQAKGKARKAYCASLPKYSMIREEMSEADQVFGPIPLLAASIFKEFTSVCDIPPLLLAEKMLN